MVVQLYDENFVRGLAPAPNSLPGDDLLDVRQEETGAAAKHLQLHNDAQLVLAADRTLLAMERTYAAWVRTGLAALASGVAARGFMDKALPLALANTIASLLIVFSGFCFVAGVWRELTNIGAASPDLRRIPPRALLGANTVMVLTSISALVGIWIA